VTARFMKKFYLAREKEGGGAKLWNKWHFVGGGAAIVWHVLKFTKFPYYLNTCKMNF
jgi:hypothetical protein